MKASIWFISGNSAGHLYPLIELSNKELEKDGRLSSLFFLPDTFLLKSIIKKQSGYQFYCKFLRYRGAKSIFFAFDSIFIFFYVFYICVFFRPKKMYSTGGYFSLPFSLASFFLQIPFFLYHLDGCPGKAARVMSILNPYQYVLFEETKKNIFFSSNALKTSYPLRYRESDILLQSEAKKKLKIQEDCFVLFILGGSQGASEINEYIMSSIDQIENKKIYIIHQTGSKEATLIKNFYSKKNIPGIFFSFKENLSLYYSVADLIVSRGGAGALAEINFFNKLAIIIPLKRVAGNHQKKNALLYLKRRSNLFLVEYKANFILRFKKIIDT